MTQLHQSVICATHADVLRAGTVREYVNADGEFRWNMTAIEGRRGPCRDRGMTSFAATCSRSLLKYLIKQFISIPYQ
jgi:hypothetical protein